MGPLEFEKAMLKIKHDDSVDIEERHQAADALMCQTLNSLGYGEGVKVFLSTDRWYKVVRKIDLVVGLGIALALAAGFFILRRLA